jgi:glycerol-3-phosphate dehydrogenase
MADGSPTVLVLGAGINGCAIARELVLNDVNVWIVDTADIASGATSGSSRLIHGGLRYLEYREFDLVKESLGERTRLLRLAPQFVRPLRLWIPAANRFGGWYPAIGKFLHLDWWPQPQEPRGSALVRAGLMFYDAYAQDESLPGYQCGRADQEGAPAFDAQRYRRACAYYDGQVEFPERLLLAMLQDAEVAAQQRGREFRVLTHHQARRAGEIVNIEPMPPESPGEIVSSQSFELRPQLIVNATGAWVDDALARLEVPADRLMGGTKGSHLFTFSKRLKEQLHGEQGVYAEASDGRPIFITPLGDTVLIGTTDVKFNGPPGQARATDEEIQYLIDSTNEILPGANLERSDITFHYSAVRPLPYVDAKTTAAITRRHFFVEHAAAGVPVISIVGGKLTTMRSLAEQAAADVLDHLRMPVTAHTRERIFPGAEHYPTNRRDLAAEQRAIARRTGFSLSSVECCWTLYGTACEPILTTATTRALVTDTQLPVEVVRGMIEREQAANLADLVERRTMLLYLERLSRASLEHLARVLVDAGRMQAQATSAAVDAECQRLMARYGRAVS